MTLIAVGLCCFAAAALALQYVSCALAWPALNPRRASATIGCPGGTLPPATLIRPICGLDFAARDTLASSFRLAHPEYEIIFCVADPRDPAADLVRELMAAHPDVAARLLVGAERASVNPKLDNCAKGFFAARYDWIVMADSNLLLPPDYLARLFARWDKATGLVSAPPIGVQPETIGAEWECAFLNSYQARIQYAVAALGLGFAQGKTLFFRRRDLREAGGYAVLAAEPAEDAAFTKAMRRLGLRVRLAGPGFGQPLGPRSFGAVWSRQMRWARLRRATFPVLFAPEILSGGFAPILAIGVAAALSGWSVAAVVPAFAAAWYACEALLTRAARWPMNWRSPLLWILRDLAIPALWIMAWTGGHFVWRGNPMTVGREAGGGAVPGFLANQN